MSFVGVFNAGTCIELSTEELSMFKHSAVKQPQSRNISEAFLVYSPIYGVLTLWKWNLKSLLVYCELTAVALSYSLCPHKLTALHTESNGWLQPSPTSQISIFVVVQFSWSCHLALAAPCPSLQLPCSYSLTVTQKMVMLWVCTGCAMG